MRNTLSAPGLDPDRCGALHRGPGARLPLALRRIAAGRGGMPGRLGAGVAAIVLAFAAPGATADTAPRVVATIAPIHSLVSMVMAGVGTPDLLIPATTSEHDMALRPSQAALLARADLVVRVGAGLERELDSAIANLAPHAVVVDIAQMPGIETLSLRNSALFEPHDHEGHDAHAQADHDHDHPAEGAAAPKADDDDHDHDYGHGHGHAPASQTGAEAHHGHADDTDAGGAAIDPHVWLDPANGRAILAALAQTLAQADPAQADAYRANAAAGQAALATLEMELAATLAPVQGRAFFVFHDAYHYFENRFGIEATGAIALHDVTLPGAQRLSQIRAALAQSQAVCVFAEPQLPDDLVATVVEGTRARTGILDPLGTGLDVGPDLYPDLLRALARSLVTCLG